jgi:hypothetical protein
MLVAAGPCVVRNLDISEMSMRARSLARYIIAAWLPYFDDGEHRRVSA